MARLTEKQIRERLEKIDKVNQERFERGYMRLVQETGYEWNPQIIVSHGQLPVAQLVSVKSQRG